MRVEFLVWIFLEMFQTLFCIQERERDKERETEGERDVSGDLKSLFCGFLLIERRRGIERDKNKKEGRFL